jgi:hypothetical protein
MAFRQRPRSMAASRPSLPSLIRSRIPVPLSSQSQSLRCQSPFVLRGQVHEQKKQRAKVTQHHPSLGSPSSAQPLPVTNSSSPSHLFSLFPTFPSSSYFHSHVPHTLPRRPRPRSCITTGCVQDDQSSVIPLSLHEEDFDVDLPGVDLKTDTANGVKELRSCASGIPLPIDDLSHNA